MCKQKKRIDRCVNKKMCPFFNRYLPKLQITSSGVQCHRDDMSHDMAMKKYGFTKTIKKYFIYFLFQSRIQFGITRIQFGISPQVGSGSGCRDTISLQGTRSTLCLLHRHSVAHYTASDNSL